MGYKPFSLHMTGLNLQPSERDLISHSLQTNEQINISSSPDRKYGRLEDYVVEHLVDYDDISYDEHAELIYDLATQSVDYFRKTGNYS